MKKQKSNKTMIALLSMIAAVIMLGTGCADRTSNVSSQDLETETAYMDISDTQVYDTQALHTEQTTAEEPSEDVPIGETYFFEREDKISTMFYDLQIDGVTFTDAVGDVIADGEREFMVLDVAITPCGDELVFSMYAQEFLMVCFTGDFVNQDYEKLYPLEEGLEEGQLEDMWLATVGEEIKGKLVYDIPKDAFRNVLLVYDSYTTGYSNETVFGDGYMMTIPKENWSRETESKTPQQATGF